MTQPPTDRPSTVSKNNGSVAIKLANQYFIGQQNVRSYMDQKCANVGGPHILPEHKDEMCAGCGLPAL